MASTAILAIRIISDASNASAGLDEAATGAERFQQRIGAAAQVATGVAVGLAAIGAASVQAASDAQQAAGAVESVFGASAAQVDKLAASAAQAVGLSTSAYSNLAAVFGSQLKNLGVEQDQIVGKTDELIRLGSDLAATFGGTTAEAVEAIGALFRGEADPIERFGVSIKESDISARLAAQGLDKLEGSALTQAQTQARLALLYEQTSAAQGAFGRESNTLAGQQQRMTAEFENAKASLGTALLPVLTQVAEKFAGIANWIGQNTGLFYTLVGVVGGLAAVLITINAVMTVYSTVSAAVAAIKAIETTAWIANAAAVWAATWPILAVIAIIVAVIAVVLLVINNLDVLRGWWDIAFEAGRTAIRWVWDLLQQIGSWISGVFIGYVNMVGTAYSTAFGIAKSVVNALLAPIRAVIDAVKSLIDWIGRISFPDIGGFISSINPFSSNEAATFGAPAGAATMMAGPATFGLRTMAATTSNPFLASFGGGAPGAGPAQVTNINVTVNGAIDPVSTGKQIRDILTRTDRSLGAVNAVRLTTNRGAA